MKRRPQNKGITVVSKGKKKAEIILALDGGGSQTRHLQFKDGAWKDKYGYTYDLSGV